MGKNNFIKKFEFLDNISIMQKSGELSPKMLDYSYTFLDVQYITINNIFYYINKGDIVKCILGNEYLKIKILTKNLNNMYMEVLYNDIDSIDIYIKQGDE